MKVSKGVRLSELEARMVDDFLKRNPIFDFSTLIRAALRQFLLNPSIDIQPVKILDEKRSRRGGVNV